MQGVRGLPAFPFGAVYFRKSNPPRADWERDYRTAAEDGLNVFRHWFLWSAIEVAPGEFDWEDYDRQLDLAAENGLKTIVAEMITAAPEWAFRRFAHARIETRDGRRLESGMSGSCATGGFPGLCLDNEDYRAAAEGFLKALVARYQGHPGLGGYDIWNECNFGHDTCYCPATAERFRAWLKIKYGDLRTLGATWRRHSFEAWEDVTPPRSLGPYPHVMDWLQFRVDNAYRLMRWRAELVRSLDREHPVTAHGVAGTLTGAAPGGADDWRAAAEVEGYGFTWIASRRGDEPWKQFHAADLVRAACRGKAFWHAEAQGGPLWMQPQVLGRPREDGRIATPEDLRYWHMVSFMAGARGLLYPRWRPLLDGPLFGAFGPYGMDGSRTPRSVMSGKIAKWANAPEQEGLWRSRPVQGEVGLVYAPETQVFTYAQQGNTDFYARSMQGAYRGFFDAGAQADWVHIEHIEEYDLLYLPFPVMLTQATADRLRRWVEAGGSLVCEGCPGYFGDQGRAGTVQPNLGLDEVFGAKEAYVEFTPDLLGDLQFHFKGTRAQGGLFLQTYELTTGKPVGWYGYFKGTRAQGEPLQIGWPFEGAPAQGGPFLQAYEPTTGVGWSADWRRVVAVEHAFGKGRTWLIGTMAGAGYAAHPGRGPAAFFRKALRFGGKKPHVRCSDPRVKARLHDGPGGAYLWVANPARQAIRVRLELGDRWGPFRACRSLWGGEATVDGRRITLTAGARDVAVIALMR